MTSARVRRLAHAAVVSVAPGVGGRWATNVFSRTRTFGGRPDDVVPLGAREFAVDGNPDVRRGYLWGDGEGPTALLVHGWGADSSSMHSLVRPLRELGFTVAAFDAPAHGINPGTTATMTQYTAAVAAVLRTLGTVRVMVAHSLGSVAAVSGATEAGTDLDCVAMIAPTCTLSGVLERWAPTDMWVTRPVVERIYRELHERNGVPVSHWDVRTRGGGITCPILAMHDPHDPLVPYGDAEAIATALPDVRLVPAPGRGHLAILMAPEVKDEVSAFVAKHGWREGKK
ncbi:MAG TPA: alpha/beta hydrolase [Mycobacteriales bacterium]|jgi:Lysophospholipase